MKKNLIYIIGILVLIVCSIFILQEKWLRSMMQPLVLSPTPVLNKKVRNPLTIEAMREKTYPGSPLAIEQILQDGSNYHQYRVSYRSDGLKIYGLLTVPQGEKPSGGWPVIIFNHGYIAPEEYQTTPSVGQYASYLPVFASKGYIVFKPDYRGNGNSEGKPEGAYYSPAYATDVLNALASLKQYKDADKKRIGMWGHSMGGNITMRNLVVNTKDIKAAVIWGGVVGSYEDLSHWRDPHYRPSTYELRLRYLHRMDLQKKYGTPQTNPPFWHSIDPTYFLQDITTPIQLHMGEDDEEVPIVFSQTLYDKLQTLGKPAEFYVYKGANHNITQGFPLAMQRSLQFFDRYLK